MIDLALQLTAQLLSLSKLILSHLLLLACHFILHGEGLLLIRVIGSFGLESVPFLLIDLVECGLPLLHTLASSVLTTLTIQLVGTLDGCFLLCSIGSILLSCFLLLTVLVVDQVSVHKVRVVSWLLCWLCRSPV